MKLAPSLPRSNPTTASPPSARRWQWGQYLAIIGIPILALEVWTLTAWLLDGPRQITEFRDPGSLNWWACRVFEGLALLVAAVIGFHVVRDCIRQRRLTFDTHFALAGMTIFWADAGVNAFGPTFLFSSNFVNLSNPLGHMPFMINPDIGRMPDPILFTIPLESFGLLGAAMAICALARRLRTRYPDLSTPRFLLLVTGIGLAVEILIEFPIVALGLWTYTSPEILSIPLGDFRFAVTELVAGTCFFLLPALLRYFKDDQGHTIIERGLHRYPRGRRNVIVWMAMYAFLQLVSWFPASVPDMAYVMYETPWPRLPEWIVNDICDAPGIEGTRFGPCPGSDGYRMPGRTTRLPGEAP